MSLTDCLAIDCEMVGTGPRGQYEILARVSIVNAYSQCIMDRYVWPTAPVTDYRTQVSGIQKQHLLNGIDFRDVREQVRKMIKGRILVGHTLHHDLRVLHLSHPEWNIRDTSTYPTFVEMNRNRTPSLRWLAQRVLGWKIQNGAHSSVEDAKAAMKIYQRYEEEWENYMDESDSDESDTDESDTDESDTDDY